MDDVVEGAGYQDYTELKGMLSALGVNARLNMVRVLATTSEMTVTELAQRLLMSQPLVSWHLNALRRHELVRKHRDGRQVYCSLNLERYRLCLRLLGGLIGEGVVPPAAPSSAPAGTHALEATRASAALAVRRRVPAPRPASRSS